MQHNTDTFVASVASSPSMALSSHRLDASIAKAIARLVSQRTEIAERDLLHVSRGRRPIAEARQLAMYLVHVAAGFTMSATGEVFGRDRTTIRHACACVEDKRDDLEFDLSVSELEAEIAQMMERAHEPE